MVKPLNLNDRFGQFFDAWKLVYIDAQNQEQMVVAQAIDRYTPSPAPVYCVEVARNRRWHRPADFAEFPSRRLSKKRDERSMFGAESFFPRN